MSDEKVARTAHIGTDDARAAGGPVAAVAQLALFITTILPLIVYIPSNLNIVLTASLCVFVGSIRSVTGTPPAESMSKKARLLLHHV